MIYELETDEFSEYSDGRVASVISVAIDGALPAFDKLYEYILPDEIENGSDKILPGMRVEVPFGRGNLPLTAMVTGVSTEKIIPGKQKRVRGLIDRSPVLDTEQLALARWIKENTFCSWYDGIRLLLPPGNVGGNTSKSKPKAIKMVRLANSRDTDFSAASYTPKQLQVLEFLAENGSAAVSEVAAALNISSAIVTNLVKKEVLEAYDYKDSERSEIPEPEKTPDILNKTQLSAKQEGVFSGLLDLMNADSPQCALLRGVTGSGKTEIFIRLILKALGQGRTALMLVPEIALTPQMTAKFTGAFGENVAVIHSGLPLSKRKAEYLRIKNGSAAVVLGTRSAVFSPLRNIGIIIMDEEGEHSYRSDRNPRYHARDIAKQRAFFHKSLLLLASATPSLESYHNAKIGKYHLFELEERFGGAALPEVFIADMREEVTASGGSRHFCSFLLEQLQTNLDNHQQSMILLNRRGFHTFMMCTACGEPVICKNCNVALTFHKTDERLHCHYCGFSEALMTRCPKCGSSKMRMGGMGTQRIEDELTARFPKARILRMDADIVTSRDVYETEFTKFAAGEYDIMVGTQMIAKGLNFENVTLVGVLGIDRLLYAGDYRGYEQTFALITQVVGRCGRSGDRAKAGKAVLQTFSPDHYILRLAAAQDYRGFYENEAAVRQALTFPPFCDIYNIVTSAVDDALSLSAANKFAEIFRKQAKLANLPVKALGPTKSGVGSILGKYRYKLLIKCKNNRAFRAMMTTTLELARAERAYFSLVNISVDINGAIE